MKKVAVICAYPAGLNSGMITVDLACHELFMQMQSHDKFDASFFNTEGEITVNAGKMLLHYSLLYQQSQLEEYDLIIHWGDFGHWIEWAEQEWTKRDLDQSKKASKTIENWFNLYFLSGRDDLIKKTIIYGETLYAMNSSHLSNKRYERELKNFYEKSKACCFRDIYSVNFINHLLASDKAKLACDCSLINTQAYSNTANSFELNESLPCITSSFARSDSTFLLDCMTQVIANKLNFTFKCMNWLDGKNIQENLSQIQSSEFIFTDIYHCALNGLKLGKKVICFGRGSSSNGTLSSLSDKKKEIFFGQYLMSCHYIHIESILDAITSNRKTSDFIQAVAVKIKDDQSFSLARNLLLASSIKSKSLLEKEINSALFD